MHNQSSRKLKQFRAETRRSQIQSMMLKMRDQTLTYIEKQELDQIINLPVQNLGEQHLKKLIQFVNMDRNNAILYLGNLVIDRFLMPEHIDGVQWTIGQNENWGWLINVFNQVGYMTEEMMDYLLDRIVHKKSEGNLVNVIQALQRCLEKEQRFTIQKILQNEKVVYALLSHVQCPYEKVFIQSIKFFVSLTANEDFPRMLAQIVGVGRLEKALLHAAMKLLKYGRILAVQAVNNCLMSGVVLQNTIIRLLENGLTENDKVKVQLSYLFKAMAKNLSDEELRMYTDKFNFVYILQKYWERRNTMRQGDQIGKNAQEAMQTIGMRLFKKQQMRENSIYSEKMYEICRASASAMRDESEDITEYHEFA